MEGIHRGGHLMGRAPAIDISPGKGKNRHYARADAVSLRLSPARRC